MVDGIDGSGKGTIIKIWKEHLINTGHKVFDLKKYWQNTGRYPDIKKIESYDFIFSCEPTYTGIGNVIRQELIKNGTNYPPKAIAEAFSIDRLVLYTKIIIPMLKAGKHIIQDRGISSSLAYQTLQHKELTYDIISNLTGNKIALEYNPDHLVLADLPPEEAIKRLDTRLEKNDNVIFEKLDFLKKLHMKYHSTEFQNLFINRNTKINRLSTNVKIDIMKKEAKKLLINLLKKTNVQ